MAEQTADSRVDKKAARLAEWMAVWLVKLKAAQKAVMTAEH